MAESGALVWTSFLEQLSIGLGAAVGGWTVFFVASVCFQTNEIHIARRHIFFTNIASLLLAVAVLGILVLEVQTLRRLVWPHLGVVLPALHLLVTILGVCVNSHVCFRWVQLLLQPVGVVMHALAAAQESVQAACLESGTCMTTAGPAAGWTLYHLYVLRWFRISACMAAVWVVLGSGFLSVVLGWCWPRYTPRLFSAEHPLSKLPARKGREHRSADAQGVAVALRRAEGARSRRSPHTAVTVGSGKKA